MNFIQSVKPLFRIFQVLNLCPFSLKSEKICPEANWIFVCYSLFAIAIRIAILMAVIYAQNYVTRDINAKKLSSAIHHSQLIYSVRILELAILFESLVKRRTKMQYLTHCFAIDNVVIEKLSIDMCYKQLRRKTIRNGCIWFLTIVIAQATCIWMSSAEDVYRICFSLLYAQSFFISSLNIFQISFYLKLLRYRINVLNRVLHHLGNIDVQNATARKIDFPHPAQRVAQPKLETQLTIENRILGKLVILRPLYQLLWDQSVEINQQFKWSMPLCIVNDFLSMTLNFSAIFVHLHQSKKSSKLMIQCATWATLSLDHLFYLSKHCHETSQEAKDVPVSLHKIRNNQTSSNVKYMSFIEHFSLQLMHQQIYFEAFGFFKIDFKLMFMFMVNWILLYFKFYTTTRTDVCVTPFICIWNLNIFRALQVLGTLSTWFVVLWSWAA